MVYNIFRILADLSHLASIGILIAIIHHKRSSDGISFVTQALYLLVFLTRYVDLFDLGLSWRGLWNLIFKSVYITSAIYILYLLKRVFPSKQKETRLAYTLGGGSCASSALLALIIVWAQGYLAYIKQFLWTFSIILESTCILPQLALFRKMDCPTIIDSYYLLALGSYRGIYLINWFVRWLQNDPPDALAVVFGLIQTMLYLDFAWVYWQRRKVKLRPGLIDLDDMRQGFLIHKVFGRDDEDDIEVEVEVEAESGIESRV